MKRITFAPQNFIYDIIGMRFFYFFTLIILSSFLHAQGKNSWDVGSFHFSQGHIWAHSKSIDYVEGRTYSGEIRTYVSPKSDTFWSNTFQNTKFGFALSFIYTDNDFIGNLGALSMFIDPCILETKHIRFYPHLAIGLSYNPKYYTSDTNSFLNKNTVICLPVNVYFHGSFNLDFKINEKLQFGAFFGLQHASNGALQMSNYGLNVVGGGINARYLFYPKHEINKSFIGEVPINKSLMPYLNAGIGIRHASRNSNIYYKNYMFDAGISKFVTPRNILDAEFTFLHRQGSIDESHEILDYTHYFGAALGHELLVRRIGIVSKVGYFFANTNHYENYLFAKIGLKYYVTHNLYGSILLINKTTAADYILFGLGYQFSNSATHM